MNDIRDRGEMEARALEFIGSLTPDDPTGHDRFHAFRVARTACLIAEKEGADPNTVLLAALLHDADDEKLFPAGGSEKPNARRFMTAEGIGREKQDLICGLIDQVSYKGTDSVVPDTLEGRCVQDADRLDAIGAIGIARAFAYGGAAGRKMYDPDEPPAGNLDSEGYRNRKSHTVNHFYEKLLLLKDMMTTSAGREMAEERHRFTEEFLKRFLEEWNGTL